MLTSKQRAALRGLASSVDAAFQVGKGNISEIMLQEIASCLNRRELVKISVLKGSDRTADELLPYLARELDAEPVAAIGNKVILYRRSDDKSVKHIEI